MRIKLLDRILIIFLLVICFVSGLLIIGNALGIPAAAAVISGLNSGILACALSAVFGVLICALSGYLFISLLFRRNKRRYLSELDESAGKMILSEEAIRQVIKAYCNRFEGITAGSVQVWKKKEQVHAEVALSAVTGENTAEKVQSIQDGLSGYVLDTIGVRIDDVRVYVDKFILPK